MLETQYGQYSTNVDVKRYAFTDSLRRFVETVIAAADRGRGYSTGVRFKALI